MAQIPRPRVVFIDWFGTLSTSLFWQQWSVDGHPRRQDFKRIQTLWNGDAQQIILPWMRGQTASEQFVAFVAERIGIEYDLLFAEFVSSCEAMTLVSDRVLPLIQAIRQQGIRVAVATDNMDSFTRCTVPALRLASQFDDILSSHEIGALKGDIDGTGRSSFFLPYLDRHGVAPSACLLIDDSLCDVAAVIGMDTVRITANYSLAAALGSILKTP